MKSVSESAPTRRPSLMQLFRLRLGDRTNLAPRAPSDSGASHVLLASEACEPKARKAKKEKKPKKKKAEEDVDEAELVRVHGRAFLAEVALLQFMDGGSTAHNVQRALKKRAKLAAEDAQLDNYEKLRHATSGRPEEQPSVLF